MPVRRNFETVRVVSLFTCAVVAVRLAAALAHADDNGGGEGTKLDLGGTDGPGASKTVGTGKIVADLGFRPNVNGFKFENYGTGNKDLTAVDMKRIFGDDVCATMRGNAIILTPPAHQWMVQENLAMRGGHCMGFSVASLQLFKGEVATSLFGAAKPTMLELANNEVLQREIAYSWIYQDLQPVRKGTLRGTPNEMLDKLIAVLSQGKHGKETYTIGIFRIDPDGNLCHGHAVTPYAVEDRGNGKFGVVIYDNNYPLVARDILFDRKANTWSYNASTNPDEPAAEYLGTAESMSIWLMPTLPGAGIQPMPWAPSREGAGQNEICLDGDPENHGHLLITDLQGRRTGYAGKKLVNEIPGAEVEQKLLGDDWKADEEPTYYIPAGIAFTVTIDGSALKKADTENVVVIGPDHEIAIDDIELEPGQKDRLTFSADGRSVSYDTKLSESPTMVLGIDGPDADFEFEVKAVHAAAGVNDTLSVDSAGTRLTVHSGEVGKFSLTLRRITKEGEQEFTHKNITLAADDVASVSYSEWKGDKSSIPLVIKHADGTETKTKLSDEE